MATAEERAKIEEIIGGEPILMETTVEKVGRFNNVSCKQYFILTG